MVGEMPDSLSGSSAGPHVLQTEIDSIEPGSQTGG